MGHLWRAIACLGLMLCATHLSPQLGASRTVTGSTGAAAHGSAAASHHAAGGCVASRLTQWLPSVAGGMAQAAPLDKLAGVPESKRELYLDVAVGRAQTFVCFDGGATLPASAVNDDYCDCADGSDEPGTSACPHTQFYCANKGHVGKYLPSSLVNDGVCDCCDGSDEAFNPNVGVTCPDTCLEDGASYRAEQAEAIRVAEQGAQLKAALAAEGLKAREALAGDLTAKRASLEEARATLEQAEATAAAEEAIEASEREARETNRDDTLMSALGLGPGQPGGSADNLRLVLLSLVRRVNASAELVTLLNEQAQAAYTAELEAFNHRVQRGSAPDDGPLTPPVPATEVEWPESLDSGGYTRPEAQAARAAVTSAEDAVATLSGEVSTLERQSEEDYGPNHEWWSLRDRCVESTSSKYKYTVCPYKEAKQDHTRLGSWKGFKDGGYSHMVFKDGATCWNGPKRSMTVELRCGVQEELTQVEEPSTCTYTAVLHTPAACDLRRAQELDLNLQDPDQAPAGDGDARDEL